MIIGHRMGTTPLHQFLLGYPFRLVMTLLGTLFVWSLTGM